MGKKGKGNAMVLQDTVLLGVTTKKAGAIEEEHAPQLVWPQADVSPNSTPLRFGTRSTRVLSPIKSTGESLSVAPITALNRASSYVNRRQSSFAHFKGGSRKSTLNLLEGTLDAPREIVLDSSEVPDITAVYFLVGGERVNGYPTWGTKDKVIQSTSAGLWAVMVGGKVLLQSAEPHQGRWPHQLNIWQVAVLTQSGWVQAPGTSMKAQVAGYTVGQEVMASKDILTDSDELIEKGTQGTVISGIFGDPTGMTVQFCGVESPVDTTCSMLEPTPGFEIQGFKVGQTVQAVKSINVGGVTQVEAGAEGVVKGPSTSRDAMRIRVAFGERMINVLPGQITADSQPESDHVRRLTSRLPSKQQQQQQRPLASMSTPPTAALPYPAAQSTLGKQGSRVLDPETWLALQKSLMSRIDDLADRFFGGEGTAPHTGSTKPQTPWTGSGVAQRIQVSLGPSHAETMRGTEAARRLREACFAFYPESGMQGEPEQMIPWLLRLPKKWRDELGSGGIDDASICCLQHKKASTITLGPPPSMWSTGSILSSPASVASSSPLSPSSPTPNQPCCLAKALFVVYNRILTEMTQSHNAGLWERCLEHESGRQDVHSIFSALSWQIGLLQLDPEEVCEGIAAVVAFTFTVPRKEKAKNSDPPVQIHTELSKAMNLMGDPVARGRASSECREACGKVLRLFKPFIFRLDAFLTSLRPWSSVKQVYALAPLSQSRQFRVGYPLLFPAMMCTTHKEEVVSELGGTRVVILSESAVAVHFAAVNPSDAEALLPSNFELEVESKVPEPLQLYLSSGGIDFVVLTERNESQRRLAVDTVDLRFRALREAKTMFRCVLECFEEPLLKISDTGRPVPLFNHLDTFLASSSRVLLLSGEAAAGKTTAALAITSRMLTSEYFPVFVALPLVDGLWSEGSLSRHVERVVLGSGMDHILLSELRRRKILLVLDAMSEIPKGLAFLQSCSIPFLVRAGIDEREWTSTRVVITMQGEVMKDLGIGPEHLYHKSEMMEAKIVSPDAGAVRRYIEKLSKVEAAKLASALQTSDDLHGLLAKVRCARPLHEASMLHAAIQAERYEAVVFDAPATQHTAYGMALGALREETHRAPGLPPGRLSRVMDRLPCTVSPSPTLQGTGWVVQDRAARCQIDIGEVQLVNGVVLRGGGAELVEDRTRVDSFDVQVSVDGEKWKKVAQVQQDKVVAGDKVWAVFECFAGRYGVVRGKEGSFYLDDGNGKPTLLNANKWTKDVVSRGDPDIAVAFPFRLCEARFVRLYPHKNKTSLRWGVMVQKSTTLTPVCTTSSARERFEKKATEMTLSLVDTSEHTLLRISYVADLAYVPRGDSLIEDWFDLKISDRLDQLQEALNGVDDAHSMAATFGRTLAAYMSEEHLWATTVADVLEKNLNGHGPDVAVHLLRCLPLLADSDTLDGDVVITWTHQTVQKHLVDVVLSNASSPPCYMPYIAHINLARGSRLCDMLIARSKGLLFSNATVWNTAFLEYWVTSEGSRCGTATDASRRTLLHLLARWGRDDAIEVLVHTLQGHVNINALDKDDRTPLHLAALHGHASACQRLLICGAATSIVDRTDCTPWMLAMGKQGEVQGCVEVLDHLQNFSLTPILALSGVVMCVARDSFAAWRGEGDRFLDKRRRRTQHREGRVV